MIRVGIISAAWGAFAHLPAWRAVPGVEVVGICTAHRETAEAAAREHHLPMAFWSASEMASHPDIDVVDVGTRPSLRRDMCLAALGSGKHVYNGIPFAADLDSAKALRDAAANAGTVTAVDAYAEHLGVFAFTEELLAQGEIGQVQSIAATLDLSLFDRPQSTFPYNWFADGSNGSSAVRNLGSHLLHVLVRLFGPVASVAGTPAQFVQRWNFVDVEGGLDSEVPDTGVAILRFESGIIGTMTTSWAAACGPGFALEIRGSTGRILISSAMMPSAEATIQLGRAGSLLAPVAVPSRFLAEEGIDIPALYAGDPRGAMATSFARMVAAIGGNGEARPDFARAYHVHSVIEAIHRSPDGAAWIDPSML